MPDLTTLENSSNAVISLLLKSLFSSPCCISFTDLYTFGVALKIDLVETKNFLSLGSMPTKIAGAPSHLTVVFNLLVDFP